MRHGGSFPVVPLVVVETFNESAD